MRIIFDVNVLIRACLGSASANRLLGQCAQAGHCLLWTQALITELAATARKPRLAGRVDWDIYNDVLTLLGTMGEEIGISPPFPPCRDAKDRYLLAIAQAGNADYLVTQDDDLLSIGIIGPCRIVTPREFGEASDLRT